MAITKSRLCSMMATPMSPLRLIALMVTQLSLVVAKVLPSCDRSKRLKRLMRCSPCV